MRDPGLDRHEWETEWQAPEPLVADSPAEALPELDGLVERMMVAHGYPVDEEREAQAPEGEVVTEFLEARRITRLLEAGEAVDPSYVGGRRLRLPERPRLPGRAVRRLTQPLSAVGFGAAPGKGSPGLLPKASVSGWGARVRDGTVANV